MRVVRHLEAWRAGLFALALALWTTRGLDTADAAVHLELALSLLRGGTALSIDPGPLWVPSRPVAGGLFYQDGEALRSASAPGHALLAMPAVALAHGLTPDAPPRFDALFVGGAPSAVVRPLQADPRVVAYVLFAAACAASTLAFLARALTSLGLSPAARLAALAALALGSPLLAYGGAPWAQLPATAALAYVLHRLVAREAGERPRDRGLGVAAALVVLVRPELAVLVLAAGGALYVIERGWRRAPSRAMARFVLPLALAFVGLALWGWPEPGDGWSLARLPEGALGLLASPRTGLVVYAPFVLFAPLGVLALHRRARPLAGLAVGWLVAALVVYGGWFDWAASLAYGPRFLLPILPALALAFGAAFDTLGRLGRVGAWATVGLGALVQLPGALVLHARIPEAEGMLTPELTLAWATLMGDGAVGALGVDCAFTYVPAYCALVALVGAAGLLVELRARRALRAAG